MKKDNQNERVEERKMEIESLLEFLEDEYRSARISERTYLELKQKNLKKLEQINKKIKVEPSKKSVKAENISKKEMASEKQYSKDKKRLSGLVDVQENKIGIEDNNFERDTADQEKEVEPDESREVLTDIPKESKNKKPAGKAKWLLGKFKKDRVLQDDGKQKKGETEPSPFPEEVVLEKRKKEDVSDNSDKEELKEKTGKKTKAPDGNSKKPKEQLPIENKKQMSRESGKEIEKGKQEKKRNKEKEQKIERPTEEGNEYQPPKKPKNLPMPREVEQTTSEIQDDEMEKLKDHSIDEQEDDQKKSKPSLFKKLLKFNLKKKKEPEKSPEIEENGEIEQGPVFVDPLNPPSESTDTGLTDSPDAALFVAGEGGSNPALIMEIEKTKAIINTLKDRDKSTEERMTTISENLGEMRSLVFQADGRLRENSLKLEVIEDQLQNIAPKEIDKKFREKDAKLEKHDMAIEMLTKKLEEMTKVANRTNSTLRDIGGIENLAGLNKKINKKLDEIKELVRYIERLANKTEKYFLDINKNLEDFVRYKLKVENLDEAAKDMVRAIDNMELKFESYVTKKDLSSLDKDIIDIKSEIDNLNKLIPVAEMKIPSNIKRLKDQKDDINTLMKSIESQYQKKKITKIEYEKIKIKNEKELNKIERELISEWKNFEELAKSPLASSGEETESRVSEETEN